ncbi:MAG TPA: tripartite tricarboxylate transporter substrate binding protein [Ramlibacter sp.]|uniref:Bug family tripartite tricarboxylate transporter substrate binding protein n=1 Tax=Ramlibacter sp. TaxID=1917967 RepID=UPI002B930AB6|nr:tripartite tricarboxylate transporter substrate binding protein [Ramlibacter sp.]HVZ46536.1 tripartite tricarboxylate transporter substrate binding protein [Ramlibacter sp.]
MNVARRLLLAVWLAVPCLAIAQADRYPEQLVKIVVPYPPGGYFDRIARIMAEQLQAGLKQPFIVENRVGGSGIVGSSFVAKAKPDGYTLLIGGQTQSVTALLVNPKLASFDSIRDFSPIALLVEAPNLLVVNAESKIWTMNDLIAYVRARGGKASYASNSFGTGTHLMMELLKSRLNLDIQHVPYNGSAPAMTALAGGHVDALFSSVLDIMPLIKAGKVRAIAATSPKRLPVLPDVPTMTEAIGPGFEMSTWISLVAPAGTPPSVIAKLNSEVNRILADPAVVKHISPAGELTILGGRPERVTTTIRSELETWGKLVRDKNIVVE